MNSPTVSICIPIYNYGRFLPYALDSILNQTFTDWEIVISDNCSTDDTPEIVRRYQERVGERIRYYCNEENVGVYRNFNCAGRHARGKYVLFLCADDGLGERSLAEMVRALEERPAAVIAITHQVQRIDDNGDPIGSVYSKPLGPGFVSGRDLLVAQCRYVAPVGIMSEVLIRASALNLEAAFDPGFEHCEDNALWCSLCENGDAVYVDGAIMYQRYHAHTDTSKTKQTLGDIRTDAMLFHKLFRESSVLGGNRWLRYGYVRHCLYPWYQRAIKAARAGEWGKCMTILRYIASFSWVPWWLPYFAFLSVRRSMQQQARIRQGLVSPVSRVEPRPGSVLAGRGRSGK